MDTDSTFPERICNRMYSNSNHIVPGANRSALSIPIIKELLPTPSQHASPSESYNKCSKTGANSSKTTNYEISYTKAEVYEDSNELKVSENFLWLKSIELTELHLEQYDQSWNTLVSETVSKISYIVIYESIQGIFLYRTTIIHRRHYT